MHPAFCLCQRQTRATQCRASRQAAYNACVFIAELASFRGPRGKDFDFFRIDPKNIAPADVSISTHRFLSPFLQNWLHTTECRKKTEPL